MFTANTVPASKSQAARAPAATVVDELAVATVVVLTGSAGPYRLALSSVAKFTEVLNGSN